MEFIKLSKKNTLIQGLIFILFGVLFVAFPLSVLRSISIYLGIVILIPGVIMITAGFTNKNVGAGRNLLITGGIVTSLFGLLFILKPEIVALLLSLLIAIWVLFSGALQVAAAISIKTLGYKMWWTRFLVGLFLLAFGVVILKNALSVSVALTMWIGIMMLISGVYYLVLAFTSKNSFS